MTIKSLPPEVSYLGDDDSDYFRHVHGRALNTLNFTYMLPADRDEVKRSELHHRMLQFVFGGRNYIGPVKEALQFGEQRRVLDLGTGGGFWAIDMADEFPRAEVIGVDLAPIQPNFELCDLDQWNIPYPDNHFDLIHARSMHTGIHNYPRFLEEIARLLRPGGLVILVEPDLIPIVDEKPITHQTSGLHGWAPWIDITVPQRLADLLAATGSFENIFIRDGNIPIGFWPTDQNLLTVGQLQWMDYDLFLPALTPLFLSAGLGEAQVKSIISKAQQDLYFPTVFTPSTRLHVVYGSKLL
ncbi:S-adenosyl-L-methionine-dependent methyltransferase [Infundibulicybe gibba]|nr:S-adenosyl-L-methionine-dependent methyltransferase [Infundibulicybe gibba]